MKDPEKVKQGRRNRANGASFELRVRKDQEEKGWNISKYQNNVDFIYNDKGIGESIKGDGSEDGVIGDNLFKYGKSVAAKASRFRLSSTGFPDFIVYQYFIHNGLDVIDGYDIHFIECKTNGRMSKIEKEKAQWYLKNNLCSKFFVASKEKEGRRIKIKYTEITLNDTKN